MNFINMNDTSQHMNPKFFPVMHYFTYIKITVFARVISTPAYFVHPNF